MRGGWGGPGSVAIDDGAKGDEVGRVVGEFLFGRCS